MEKKLVGEITHYYTKLGVAVVRVGNEINIGDKISIEGTSTNFQQEIKSMQIEKSAIKKAKKGDMIGLKLDNKAREGDKVYKVIGE